MTINEMYVKCFESTPIGTELTRKEIIHALKTKYKNQINEDSILPSDLCYNSSNAGIEGNNSVRVFLKNGWGRYKYVGPNYNPDGINPHEYGTIGKNDYRPKRSGETGQFDSWIIKNNILAAKETDKSVFDHHGFGIPKEIRWFFEVDELEPEKRLDLILVYGGSEYKAYISRETALGRTRIFWFSDLSIEFNSYFDTLDNYPILLFERKGPARYEIRFIEGNKKKLIEPLDDNHSTEEQEQQAISMDMGSLRSAAESHSKKKPVEKEVTVRQITRDPYVAEYAKRRANGICQLCGEKAPFNDSKGRPYLESHHIIWIADGGEDSINNTVGLCPDGGGSDKRNLMPLCRSCNMRRSDESVDPWEYYRYAPKWAKRDCEDYAKEWRSFHTNLDGELL